MRQGVFFFAEICFPVLRAGYGIVCGSLRFAAGLRFPADFLFRGVFVSRLSVYGFPAGVHELPATVCGLPASFFRPSFSQDLPIRRGGRSRCPLFFGERGAREEEKGKTDKKLPKPTGQGRGCATVYGGIVFMIAQNVGRLPNSAEKSKKIEKRGAKPLTFQA